MSIFRTAVAIALGVALMPSDREAQERLYTRVTTAAHWTATFCERNGQTCETAAVAWAQFVKKAEFAGQLAYDVAQRYANDGKPLPASLEGPTPSLPLESAEAAPAVKPVRSPGTLRPEDLEPAWRGPQQKSIGGA